MPERAFDVVVFGASGYTGRLVAQYLAGLASQAPGPVGSWAMAGRDLAKLDSVRAELGIDPGVPLIEADAREAESLQALVGSTKVVLTTVGPYQLYGDALLAACVEAGTDYTDLCGEPAWMAAKIDDLGARAQATGSRVVFSAGFDSIPSDLGVWFLQETARARHGAPCTRVALRVEAMKGRFSGGTAASFHATMKAAGEDPGVIAALRDPFALCPGFEGPAQPEAGSPREEDGAWLAPFMMATINTKAVHRSNYLAGHPYGEDFRYDEMILTGPGEAGEQAARAVASDDSLSPAKAPKPGEGPTEAEREQGMFSMLLTGTTDAGETVRVRVTGDKDPGYGATSKMIAQTALCLASDVPDLPGGFQTTAMLDGKLLERLRRHAGLTFEAV